VSKSFFSPLFSLFYFFANVIKIFHPKNSLGISWMCFCFLVYFNFPILPLLQNPRQKKFI
jgi:hypothetical protein